MLSKMSIWEGKRGKSLLSKNWLSSWLRFCLCFARKLQDIGTFSGSFKFRAFIARAFFDRRVISHKRARTRSFISSDMYNLLQHLICYVFFFRIVVSPFQNSWSICLIKCPAKSKNCTSFLSSLESNH